MFSYSILPTPLLVLLFTLPVLSVPTTPYDPFHDISIHAPKPPDPPICCLRPLTPLEPTEEEVLLSFEEWKAKRLADANKEFSLGSHLLAGHGHKPGSGGAVDTTPESNTAATAPAKALPDIPDVSTPSERLSPHFRIPITDRFNYASMDCSARVHGAHRSAKSASSILSSKKDRYMLSPCAEPNQFVVVELCEDIRIDTVQMANYEFFSGVFKDFSVSVAKTYTTDPQGWTPAGMYRARNGRGVQSFHPPTSLSDFYRFIRIDFHSHYGNEYYCPLSLLRVYGLTHLEHWKWGMWEDESKAKRAAEEAVEESPKTAHVSNSVDLSPLSVKAGDEIPSTGEVSISHWHSVPNGINDNATTTLHSGVISSHIVTAVVQASAHSSVSQVSVGAAASLESTELPPTQAVKVDIPIPTMDSSAHLVGEPPADHIPQSPPDPPPPNTTDAGDNAISTSNDSERQHYTDSLCNTNSSSEIPHLPSTPVSIPNPSSRISSASLSLPSEASNVSTVLTNNSSHTLRPPLSSVLSSSSIIPTHTAHPLTVVPHPAQAPAATGGESIYRTIMNRLTALEANTTLYARYVEGHTVGVREMLRRLSEDVGRLEGIGKAQAQMYQRSVLEFERQRKRMEVEQRELLSKVSNLADEVVLEKRLGIAQLCLLLAVLVFMALTRGSRGEPLHNSETHARSRTSSMRDWGRRTLSFSGDWMNKFRSSSRSPEPSHLHAASHNVERTPDKVDFPSTPGVQAGDGFPRSKRLHPITGGRKVGVGVLIRPRTLSARSPVISRVSSSHNHNHNHPVTPTGPFTSSLLTRQHANLGNGLTQSVSLGLIGPVPKSAKRWARSAHLHEVKNTRRSKSVHGVEKHKEKVDVEEEVEGRGISDSPGEQGTTKSEGDVFSPRVQSPVLSNAGSGIDTEQFQVVGVNGSGSERGRMSGQKPLSAGDLHLGCVHAGSVSEAETSEGDAWVDTDADCTDSEIGERAQGRASMDSTRSKSDLV